MMRSVEGVLGAKMGPKRRRYFLRITNTRVYFETICRLVDRGKDRSFDENLLRLVFIRDAHDPLSRFSTHTIEVFRR